MVCILGDGPVKFIEITSLVRFSCLKTSTIISKVLTGLNPTKPVNFYKFNDLPLE